MIFTKIKRLVSFGNHENIELEAKIEDGEDLTECHGKLVNEIYNQIGLYEGALNLQFNLDEMQQTINSKLDWIKSLEKQIEALQDQKTKIESWLSKFRISVSAFNDDEIPF
jgi:hypothetical protein